MKKAVLDRDVPHCQVESCGGLVKPDIVFFGEALPEEFFLYRTLPAAADLCIVMGTSLAVQPFASLPGFCRDGVPRLLINNERVGGLGSRADDVLVLGDCDQGVHKLAEALGWLEELESTWERVNPDGAKQRKPEPAAEDDLEDQIARLTEEVDQSLQISKDHSDRVKSELNTDDRRNKSTDEVSNDTIEPQPKGALGDGSSSQSPSPSLTHKD